MVVENWRLVDADACECTVTAVTYHSERFMFRVCTDDNAKQRPMSSYSTLQFHFCLEREFQSNKLDIEALFPKKLVKEKRIFGRFRT